MQAHAKTHPRPHPQRRDAPALHPAHFASPRENTPAPALQANDFTPFHHKKPAPPPHIERAHKPARFTRDPQFNFPTPPAYLPDQPHETSPHEKRGLYFLEILKRGLLIKIVKQFLWDILQGNCFF
ncbi:hypothetical protein [Helicobacter himalayensis]|uniref:hypothetical protein n=1 Tax=Helicobacter himalayensis TaxID=1591088 RepID=UPI00082EC93C|nr:hypothetical protein [Helicobacter himalayensis]